ncbi:Nonribosomal peptide synthetase 10 [Madurella mycetomatis]|uniref:Nonribosomal peptide synthetase 10 n=1 Tax=Madurella mycetomatis TaxID=100816 RepID=A0A175W351_9PEZI|nr:Nonribosomal peptide synthetase 10 [Madurella mycetomatis]
MLFAELCRVLRLPASSLHLRKSFSENGGDSIHALWLCSAWKIHGIDISLSDVLKATSLEDLITTATHLLPDDPRPPPCFQASHDTSTTRKRQREGPPDGDIAPRSSKRLRAASSWCPVTETQRRFLHPVGRRRTPNVVRFAVEWPTRQIPDVKRAWMTALASEPIFSSQLEQGHDDVNWYINEKDEFEEPPWREILVHTEPEYIRAVERYTKQLTHDRAVEEGMMWFTVIVPSRTSNLLPDPQTEGTTTHSNSTVIWNVHHALVDGLSCDIILQKVQLALGGGSVHRGPSFVAFANRLAAHQAARSREGESFWKRQKERYGSPPAELALPPVEGVSWGVHNDVESGGADDADQGQVRFYFPQERLREAAGRLRVSIASLYLAAWAVTLSSLANSDRIQFGVVLSGRTLPFPHVGHVVGPLISTLPLTLILGSGDTTTFADLARHVHARVAELSAFSWTLPRHGYSNDWASAISVRQPIEKGDADARATTIPSHSYHSSSTSTSFVSHVPLSVSVEPDGLVHLQYHRNKINRFQAETIRSLYSQALSVIELERDTPTSAQPQTLLHSEIVPAPMTSWLRAQSNADSVRTTELFECGDLVSLFREAVAVAGPGAVAVEKADARLTYEELDRRSEAVAAQIAALVRPGEPVAVHVDRSLNWIVAVYAVLKAAAVYCPLHSALPPHVRDEQFAAGGCTLFLIPGAVSTASSCIPASCRLVVSVQHILNQEQERLRHGIYRDGNGNNGNSAHVKVDPGVEAEEVAAPKDQDQKLDYVHPLPAVTSGSPAYICFTSGSSGKPKGVLCRHGGLVAFQRDPDVRLRARPGWRIAQTMSPSFDGSIHEIFSALSYGATLVLPRDECDPLGHLADVDAAVLTPTVAAALRPDAPELARITTVYLIGEAVPQHVCDDWAVAKDVVFNMYGPTEATCGATTARLRPGVPVTVGRPNPSCRVYVLDRNLQLTPPGFVGEIYLAGVQVAVGYVGVAGARGEATAVVTELNTSRFLDDVVCPGLGERMYRTGDRGCWGEDGQLHVLGRNDRQIKHRGFRIDMDDVEARVHSLVPDASGVAVMIKDGELILVLAPTSPALDSMHPSLDIAVVRRVLAAHLPAQMMPRHIYLVDKFPITQAGKLDYATTAKMIRGTETTIESNALANLGHRLGTALGSTLGQLERDLAGWWQQILSLAPNTPVPYSSNFIDLGGDSISALKLQSRIENKLGCRVPVGIILGTPNLRGLAAALYSITPPRSSGVVIRNEASISAQTSSDPRQEPVVSRSSCLSPMERALWMQDGSELRSTAFNVSLLCKLGPSIQQERLEQSFNSVLGRHDVLRSQYHGLDGNQPYRTLSEKPPRVTRTRGDFDARAEVNRPFDLAAGGLFRVFISPTQLLVLAHHIICDLTTLRRIMREVRAVYDRDEKKPGTVYTGANIGADGNHAGDDTAAAASYLSQPFLIGQNNDSSAHLDVERLGFWREYLAVLPRKETDGDLAKTETRTEKNTGGHVLSRGAASSSGLERNGSSIVFKIQRPGFWERMEHFAKERNMTLHQILLAATTLALHNLNSRWHGRRDADLDCVLGAPHMNRERNHVYEDMVGLFLQPLPVRIRWPSRAGISYSRSFQAPTGKFENGSPNMEEEVRRKHRATDAVDGKRAREGSERLIPEENESAIQNEMDAFLKSVKNSSEQALGHAVPFEMLCAHLRAGGEQQEERVEHGGVVRRMPSLPLFDVMVTLHRPGDWGDSLMPGLSPLFSFADGAAKFNCLVEWTAPSASSGDELAPDPDSISVPEGGAAKGKENTYPTRDGLLRVEYSPEWATASEVGSLAQNMFRAVEAMIAMAATARDDRGRDSSFLAAVMDRLDWGAHTEDLVVGDYFAAEV